MSDSEILEIFYSEAKEIISNIETELVQLEESFSEEVVNSLFRNYHTLKGSSGIAGFTEVSEFTHIVESLLDKVREGELDVSHEMIDLLLTSLDIVKVLIFEPEHSEEISQQKNLVEEQLVSLAGTAGTSLKRGEKQGIGESKSNYFRVKMQFRGDIFEFGIDPLMLVEDLCDAGEVLDIKINRSSLPNLDEINPEKCYISWMVILKTKKTVSQLEDIFLFVKDDNTIEITDVTEDYREDLASNINEEKKLGKILVQRGLITEDELLEALKDKGENEKLGTLLVRKKMVTEKDIQNALGLQIEVRKKIESTTIRVETNKLDNILNLLGEIVIGQSSISRFAEELEDEKAYALKNSLYALNRATRQFQEQIMAMRMIPIGPTFNQFKRFVRDTSRQIGKEIDLVIKGKETELDKTVIEEITDPLKHMIRNAIDHGIESTEERLEKGKSANGTVELNAYHQEGSVFIDVKDDGQGLDPEKLRETAIAKGFLQKDREVSEAELLQLIMQPGFSTAKTVGDLSGRGVGMDVVKSNIDSLRGSIQIFSKKGEGTTFRIKLPLTLAIIDGMLIKVGESIYIIPLLSILESIQPKQEAVKTVKGQGEVILVRDQYISLVRLYDYFGLEAQYLNPWEALVIIVESNGEKLAVMIDDLIGQQQIVIKSLDSYITHNKSISGAAILGDGNVALIIDIHGLLNEISSKRGQYAGATS